MTIEVLRAPAVKPGDRIAVVAPSSPVLSRDALDRGVGVLTSWGYEVALGEHVHAQTGHLAGTDEQRRDDLNHAIRDPGVRAVMAARGGYGMQRIVDGIDWEALAEDPKVLVGYSDTTVLLQAAWRRLKLVTIHGQFAGRLHLQDEDGRRRLRALIAGDTLPPLPLTTVLAGGTATGRLQGGNLALLASGVGTPDQMELAEGDVLLLEDVNEPPYAIDRMLTQLKRAGLLRRAGGIVAGEFTHSDPPAGRPSAAVDEVLADRLGDLGVPVVSGMPTGHTDAQAPLPHGGLVEVDTMAGELRCLEPAVSR